MNELGNLEGSSRLKCGGWEQSAEWGNIEVGDAEWRGDGDWSMMENEMVDGRWKQTVGDKNEGHRRRWASEV